MERIIMHIDVNNAFLSWTALELLENGYKEDIREIPSIIAGDPKKRTGIVLAKSNPAKKMGIKTAQTIYEAQKRCKNLKLFPPNYKMYEKRSNDLFKLILKYSPDIEKASIDECYLDYGKVKKLYGDEIEFAKKLQKEIFDTLGFTVNSGIANNKLCAKMASDFEKPFKIHTLFNNEKKEKMFPLPIEDLFTVGKSTSIKLRNIGIKTIGDLASKKSTDLKMFKNQAVHLIEIANGIDNSIVDSSSLIPKGISNEITLSYNVTDIKKLEKVLAYLSEEVSRRVRKEQKYASVICVILKDSNFRRYSHQKKLKNPVNSYNEIYKYAKEILSEFYSDEPIRLIGLRLDDLRKETNYQTSLFDNEKQIERHDEKLDKVIDKINNKYGSSTIKRASHIEK